MTGSKSKWTKCLNTSQHPVNTPIPWHITPDSLSDRHVTRWMWQHQETHAIRLLCPGHTSVQVQSKCGSNEATAKDHHLRDSHGLTSYSGLCTWKVNILSSSTRYWSKVQEHQDLGGYVMRCQNIPQPWTYLEHIDPFDPFCICNVQRGNAQDWPGLRTAYRSSPPKRRRRAATSRAVGSGKRWPSQRCFRYPALHRWYDLRRYDLGNIEDALYLSCSKLMIITIFLFLKSKLLRELHIAKPPSAKRSCTYCYVCIPLIAIQIFTHVF